MSTKKQISLSIPQPLKKRKALDLDTKMMVIRYKGGKKVNAIACDMKISHSTVSTTLKDKDRISEAVNRSAPMPSTVITKQCTGVVIWHILTFSPAHFVYTYRRGLQSHFSVIHSIIFSQISDCKIVFWAPIKRLIIIVIIETIDF